MDIRRLKIYFDDGEKISLKEGILTSQDEFCITLDYKVIIPKARVVRMEMLGNGL
ncbi:hypothetical protein J4434_06635 [Candidatus Woesearchaeota archaeon]|nr:hypothetical protein [Candidatus Woesearchaeota archaeon]